MDNDDNIKIIKETRNLVWMCIAFVFLLMMLLLMTLSGNHRTERHSSLIVDRVGNVQTDLSSVTKSIDTFTVAQKKLAQEVKSDMRKMNQRLQATAKSFGKIGQSVGRIDKSVGKVLSVQANLMKEMSSKGKDVKKSIEVVHQNQQKILEDINNIHNTERMVLLREFIQNQTRMLNEFSATMDTKPVK